MMKLLTYYHYHYSWLNQQCKLKKNSPVCLQLCLLSSVKQKLKQICDFKFLQQILHLCKGKNRGRLTRMSLVSSPAFSLSFFLLSLPAPHPSSFCCLYPPSFIFLLLYCPILSSFHHARHSVTAVERIQALAILEYGAPIEDAARLSGLAVSTVYQIRQRAGKQGYNSAISTVLKNEYVKKTHLGHPQIFEKDVEEAVKTVVKRDQFEWEKNLKIIALDTGMSAMTVWRVLKWMGYEKRKPSRKPDLTSAMKQARLQFALRHQD